METGYIRPVHAVTSSLRDRSMEVDFFSSKIAYPCRLLVKQELWTDILGNDPPGMVFMLLVQGLASLVVAESDYTRYMQEMVMSVEVISATKIFVDTELPAWDKDLYDGRRVDEEVVEEESGHSGISKIKFRTSLGAFNEEEGRQGKKKGKVDATQMLMDAFLMYLENEGASTWWHQNWEEGLRLNMIRNRRETVEQLITVLNEFGVFCFRSEGSSLSSVNVGWWSYSVDGMGQSEALKPGDRKEYEELRMNVLDGRLGYNVFDWDPMYNCHFGRNLRVEQGKEWFVPVAFVKDGMKEQWERRMGDHCKAAGNDNIESLTVQSRESDGEEIQRLPVKKIKLIETLMANEKMGGSEHNTKYVEDFCKALKSDRIDDVVEAMDPHLLHAAAEKLTAWQGLFMVRPDEDEEEADGQEAMRQLEEFVEQQKAQVRCKEAVAVQELLILAAVWGFREKVRFEGHSGDIVEFDARIRNFFVGTRKTESSARRVFYQLMVGVRRCLRLMGRYGVLIMFALKDGSILKLGQCTEATYEKLWDRLEQDRIDLYLAWREDALKDNYYLDGIKQFVAKLNVLEGKSE
ncbi:hypothetical protein BCR43DRAFT_513584 [Syncephalastrum racemosum]|uniref:Uncharacterized protein n=1 Tax=Syncephalastrum racemosum TaxID=13706 RepID=A0A1X2HE16_SYNRA|nr:hypothetical protein BCR43DRAFT_513584 [Syncephalastrum racemosum]